MKKIIALLLAMMLCLSLFSGCGSTETSSEASDSSETESTAETTEIEDSDTVEETDSTEETNSINESEAEAETESSGVSYPIDGDYTLSIVINPNGLIASLLGDSDFSISESYSAMEEATGVKLDWTLYSEATFTEQFNLLMASNDWPDLFDCGVTSRYSTGVTGLLEDEVVVELSDYLEDYAPDYLNLLNSNEGFAESVIQEDGSIVEFATASAAYEEKGLMIRQDWLDELGLETPTTIDELTEVLTAFKNEYGLTMSLMVYAGLDTGLTYAYNIDRRGFSNSGMGWVVEDGTVVTTFDTDGFREYLALLVSYYEQGIFNDDFVNISDELNTVDSTYLSGDCGVFYAGVSALSETQKQSATDENFQLTALADIKVNEDDPNSGVSEISYTGVNSIAISTQCENPEVAMMFCNYFYTEEGQLLANWGVEGETYTINDEGEPEYTETVLNDAECFMYMLTLTKYALQWAPTIFDSSVSLASYDDVQRAAIDMWTECREDYLLIPKMATTNEDEQEIENEYGNDVSTYLWENIFKIVTGQLPLDDYDAVLETAYSMGLTELTEARQSSYDRYMENHPES